VPRRGESTGLSIDATQFDVHETDGPVTALGFCNPDEFSADGFADEPVVAVPFDLPHPLDPPHLVGRVLPRGLEPRGVGAG